MSDEAKELAAARRALLKARAAFEKLADVHSTAVLTALIIEVDNRSDALVATEIAERARPVDGGIRVCDLDQSVLNKRIRVVQVAMSEAERRGHVDDSKRLAGMEGVVRSLVKFNQTTGMAQLRVLWDRPEIAGSLMLADQDVIEILN